MHLSFIRDVKEDTAEIKMDFVEVKKSLTEVKRIARSMNTVISLMQSHKE